MIEINKRLTRLSIILVCVFIFNVNMVFSDGTDLVVAKRDVLGNINIPPAIGAGEYIELGPEETSFTNEKGSFHIQTYRSADGSIEEMQFYFEINDPSPSPDEDQIRIKFDLDHNDSATDFDHGIRIFRELSGGPTNKVRVTNVNLFGDPTDQGDLPGSQWSVDPGALSWTAEVKIRAADLGLNFIPNLIGMHIHVITFGETPSLGLYPSGVNASQIASWTNLKTRLPLEYVLLLDQSGSMLEDTDGNYPVPDENTKWTTAKKATDIFAQVYHTLRTPYFSDKIGLAKYTWIIGDPVPDKSASVKELTPLNNFATIDGYTDSDPAPGVAYGSTPIKSGLNISFSMFDPSSDMEKIVLLMSDGIHNKPTWDFDDTPYEFPVGIDQADLQVNTVAFGQDGAVDTELMDSISTEFSGFGASYNNALEGDALVNAYVENLFSHLYLNEVEVDASGTFPVNLNEPRLLVMLIWNSAGVADRHFWIKKPDNTFIRYDMLPAAGVTHHHYRDTVLNYEVEYYLIESPDVGSWQTVQTDGATPEVADNSFALFDPAVYAFFSVVQQGECFILKGVLKEQGLPITEPQASVLVEVSKPDEGLGTYASTAQTDCTLVEPILPIKFKDDIRTMDTQPVAESTTTTAINQPNIEPLPKHIAKIKELFRICGKDGLNRSDRLPLRLYDDGTHGDADAGDGVFTLRYTETQHEGTYTFNFRASGNAPSGSAFSRIKTLSIHKSVNVAPDYTIFDSRLLKQIGNIVDMEYYIVPKDINKEYLGPGHSNQIEFFTTVGKWVSPIRDYNNGIYSRFLRYDITRGEPDVTPVIQGKPVKPIKTSGPTIPCWIYLIIIIILLIIIGWLVWLAIRRRSP